MTQYQQAFEAGVAYGKSYRRGHHSWSSDLSVARDAAWMQRESYELSGYIMGVVEGLRPFAASDFADVFKRNERAAKYRAYALLGNIRLEVVSQDEDHYQKTLAYWEQLGATLLRQESMIQESSISCAYELCKKIEPIEIVPGHRRKLYHNENCRQAQHRLLEARALLATLRQLWSDYLPATQHLLEEILARQGEACVRSIAAAIAAERKQARYPLLSEDERTTLKHQWSDLQRGTQQLLESILDGGRSDPSILFPFDLACDP